MLDRAKADGRPLTAAEREEASGLIKAAEDARDSAAIAAEIDRMNYAEPASSTGRFAKAVADAGFDLRANPSVEVPLASALFKAPTVPAVTDWNRTTPTVAPL